MKIITDCAADMSAEELEELGIYRLHSSSNSLKVR